MEVTLDRRRTSVNAEVLNDKQKLGRPAKLYRIVHVQRNVERTLQLQKLYQMAKNATRDGGRIAGCRR
jgi:hypothetical protein